MKWHAQLGFTLVELVVVISVMTIVSAVAAPRFVGNDIFQTRGDADILAASLRYAQKTAIAQRRTVFVSYHTTNRSIDLCFNSNCTSRLQDPVSGGNYRATLSRNVSVVIPNLAFDAAGRPIPNALTTLKVTNARNTRQSFEIVVEDESGYIHS